MSHVAVWTDSEGRVERLHYKPDEVDTSNGRVSSGEVPDPSTPDWVDDTLHYDEANDSFYYESTDPFDGLPFSENEKQAVYDAVRDDDLVEIRNIVENALNS